jgi:pimeloyl-ACP methyl ester carboxylesterase
MRVRTYGQSGPLAIALHGGPGAPGVMAPVARALADRFRVLEPFQRSSGPEPLTVARHVADLRELVESLGEDARPALVGSSWGAMLALAFAAAHPDLAGPLALIGCGTFDPAARARFNETLEARMDAGLRQRLAALGEDELAERGRLILPLYCCDAVTEDLELEECDARGHREPAIMLHGAEDPHPGRMILASLRSHMPQLEYREWARCGHYPWIERAARDDFFACLRSWLTAAA